MKKIEKITWKFLDPPPELLCMACNREPATHFAAVSEFVWKLPVCESCAELDEGTLINVVKMG